MTDYTKLVKALRHCSHNGVVKCNGCKYDGKEWPAGCMEAMMRDAAAAIEALQAEVKFYKNFAEEWQETAYRKERLLGMYRAHNMYSAKDKDGHLIATQCANMNRSENPNS